VDAVPGAQTDRPPASELRSSHRLLALRETLVDSVHKCATVDSVHNSTDGEAPLASTATQPTAAPQDRSSDAASGQRVTAREWFASGARRPYDPVAKTLLETARGEGSSQPLHVFEKVVATPPVGTDVRWLTMLPGYPDGSYGYAQVDRHLGPRPGPRLYVEYLGQGDSDKPARLRYSSIERADLIQAQWRAHGIRRTMVVSFDYSSLALLELLRRQQERDAAGENPGPTIDAVFIINGGLFADSHSHPWDTTPMLKTPVGRVAMWFGQHVPGVFEATLRAAKLFSPSYEVSAAELANLSDAILRRRGAAFMHRAAGFVDEHRRNAKRWDLAAIVRALETTVAFHIAGSEDDPFEPRQIIAARERLAPFGVDVRMFPGGHLTTSEHPELLADAIRELADAHGVGETVRHATPAKP
jgi:pimeloyl-ACP methyl ester carboxylesterase